MIRIYADYELLSQAAASLFIDLADQAVAAHGRFCVALSGGSTPRRMYELLATMPFRNQIKWDSVHIFWGDERCVPADDPRSNALMARQALLDHVPVPADQIHPIQGDLPPAQAAVQYEAELRAFFGSQPGKLDLVLLGLGENAHTASLFPHSPVLNEKERWASEVYVPEQDMYRVTLTAAFIDLADQVAFIVSGADKAHALQMVLEGPNEPEEFPAQLICPSTAHPLWLVDRAASHKLVGQPDQELEE